ncbi:MAG: hypothetical protein V3T17_12875 [Pseudomonadales bacterium]
MAQTPQPTLSFDATQDPCGQRRLVLPQALPPVGNDFDWQLRDYNSFRDFMLEELAARFPERQRWTSADMEMVIVELLATELDKLSDMLDRIDADAYLETARRPDSLRRLLFSVGYDVVKQTQREGLIEEQATEEEDNATLTRFWYENPSFMERARIEGPWQTQEQERIVTVADYEEFLLRHPLIVQSQVNSRFEGSWYIISATTQLQNQLCLDETADYSGLLGENIEDLHKQIGLPFVELDEQPTPRSVLNVYIDYYRMAGQEVLLEDVHYVPIILEINIQVAPNYFASQVKTDAEDVLSTQSGKLFEAGKLGIGESLFVGDVFAQLQQVNGVESVTIDQFKRLGRDLSIETSSEKIVANDVEVIINDADALLINTTGGRQL